MRFGTRVSFVNQVLDRNDGARIPSYSSYSFLGSQAMKHYVQG